MVTAPLPSPARGIEGGSEPFAERADKKTLRSEADMLTFVPRYEKGLGISYQAVLRKPRSIADRGMGTMAETDAVQRHLVRLHHLHPLLPSGALPFVGGTEHHPAPARPAAALAHDGVRAALPA